MRSINLAKKAKNDEFYTLYEDIENELQYYDNEQFHNKIIYCNCDDPLYSNFYKFFKDNFEKYKLKKLIATGYKKDSKGIKGTFEGDHTLIESLQSDGSFDSDECIELLKEADIIITNPPFSKWTSYIKLIHEYRKDFLLISTKLKITGGNAKVPITSIMLLNNEIMGGVTKPNRFYVPDDFEYTVQKPQFYNGRKIASLHNTIWLTNLKHENIYREIILENSYCDSKYDKYDNFDAINVDKIKQIPNDYYGLMGVPQSLFAEYFKFFDIEGNEIKFELIDVIGYISVNNTLGINNKCSRNNYATKVNGKEKFTRLLIKRIKDDE